MPDSFPILIGGPTASGKSALALELAARHDAVIINADALQVYDCWRILTARPSDGDLARAPHRLYGHVAGAGRYSVGDWLRDVAPVLAALAAERRRAIVVGGTGLYLDALTRGLAAVPDVPAEFRALSEARLADGDLAGLVAELDPETRDSLDLCNPRRVQRAWEVVRATGRGLAAWHRLPQPPLIPAFHGLIVWPDIDRLNDNITLRLDRMVEAGALAEAQAYLQSFSDPTLPSAQALGAPEFMAHLRGEISLAAAVAAAATATRQYAKRQRTWFRNRLKDWPRLSPGDAIRAPLPVLGSQAQG